VLPYLNYGDGTGLGLCIFKKVIGSFCATTKLNDSDVGCEFEFWIIYINIIIMKKLQIFFNIPKKMLTFLEITVKEYYENNFNFICINVYKL
jgi:hypothetical protein